MDKPYASIKCSRFETKTLSYVMKKQISFYFSFNCYIWQNKVKNIHHFYNLKKKSLGYTVFYIISPVMHAFWLVLTYDLLEDRCIDDVIIKTFLNSLLYKTNRFQVAVHLFSNRSQMMSKCGKNKKVAQVDRDSNGTLSSYIYIL